jgi:hypothetical protein
MDPGSTPGQFFCKFFAEHEFSQATGVLRRDLYQFLRVFRTQMAEWLGTLTNYRSSIRTYLPLKMGHKHHLKTKE